MARWVGVGTQQPLVGFEPSGTVPLGHRVIVRENVRNTAKKHKNWRKKRKKVMSIASIARRPRWPPSMSFVVFRSRPMYNMTMCVIVLQWVSVSNLKVDNALYVSTYVLFDMTLQKTKKKSRFFWILKKKRKNVFSNYGSSLEFRV